MHSKKEIPFYRTLRFKLFISFSALLLVTITTTLVVHILGVSQQMESLFEGDFKPFAQELRKELEERVASGQEFESYLHHRSELLPYRVLYLPLPNTRDIPFRLTEEERRKLLAGLPLGGSATERIMDKYAVGKQTGLRMMQPNHFLALPIRHNGSVLGAVVVFDMIPDPDFRRQRLASSLKRSFSIVLLLALSAAYFLSRHLTSPIQHMEQFAQEFSAGSLSSRTGLLRQDELGVLAHAFDRMADEIEANAETRTRLLSDVSHELGTPVATIRATIEAILDGLLPPEEHQRYLQSSLDQLEHLSRIVNDVTELSRFETGRISITLHPFRGELPICHAVEAARALAVEKGISLKILRSEMSVMVEGDEQRITQVLKNLVMNAVQHNPTGTTVTAGWKVTSNSVVFSVTDDGPRVPDKHASQIFERFYKASESRTRDGTSSGLGLAIVKRILQEHGSEIQFSQTEDAKNFVFSLSRA
jgi:signal transduction histidine kinase